jgi:hypothetical protein
MINSGPSRRRFLTTSALLPSLASTSAAAEDRGVDHPALLARHDVVYLSPTAEGGDGLPIGNGDMVGWVWTPPHGLELAINKSNLWDDRPRQPPLAENWAWDISEEERWTSIVSGARLAVRSKLPILDPLYLDAFEQRLTLHEATVRVNAASAFGRVQAATWVSLKPAVLVIDYDEAAEQPVSREIVLERFGSRRLFHWYSQYDPKQTGTGLDGTAAGAAEGHIWIEQKLRSVSFAVAARFRGAAYRTEIDSRHTVRMVTERAARLRGQVLLAMVTSEEDPEPLKAARRAIDAAAGLGAAALLDGHRKYWAGFWAKSHVRVPEDYVENLYYFTLYQLAASSRGQDPPTHCGGLWFWNRDIRRWGHYYHWNVQQQYWPVHASNHPELATPYYEFRHRTLPEAGKYAAQVHKRGGAFYSDVTDRWGRGTIHQHVMYITTAGPQIAMDFWRHYLYTNDREFLSSRAYPVMRATAAFYLETLERDEHGVYHMPRSTGYENFIEQRDTITDLAVIRQHFPACIRASEVLGVDEPLRKRWREVVENLAPFAVMRNALDEDGNKLPPVFSSGIPLHDSHAGPDRHHRWTKRREVKKGERQFNISFYCELAPVFPSGIIGVGQRGTELFDVAVNTMEALGDGPAWNSLPTIAAARLGRGDAALKLLTSVIERYQRPVQGFFAELTELHEFSGNRFDMSQPFPLIDGARAKQRARLPGWWFDFPDLELGGVLMTTINEILLQSHDGVIRVFPALPPEWRDASFQLRAVGAFLVSGEMRGGEIQPVLIESLTGGWCRVANPWGTGDVSVRELPDGTPVAARGGAIEFATRPRGRYLLFRPGAETMPRAAAASGGPNEAPKEWRGRRIGIPKKF